MDWERKGSLLRAKDEGRKTSGMNEEGRSILETKEKGRSTLGVKGRKKSVLGMKKKGKTTLETRNQKKPTKQRSRMTRIEHRLQIAPSSHQLGTAQKKEKKTYDE